VVVVVVVVMIAVYSLTGLEKYAECLLYMLLVVLDRNLPHCVSEADPGQPG